MKARIFSLPASRIISVVLSSILLSGCATQSVRFTSNPSNATVTVGLQGGKTPCTLDIPDDCRIAHFVSPAGQAMDMEIPGPPSALRVAVTECRYVGGDSCRLLSIPFLVVGVLGLMVTRDGTDDWPHDDDYEDNDADLTIFAIGLASLCVGGLFYLAGEAISPSESADRKVHVNFPGAEPMNAEDLKLHGHLKTQNEAMTNAPGDGSFKLQPPKYWPRKKALPKQ